MARALSPILITFAIPHESSELRRHLPDDDCRIVHTGIGAKAATARVNEELSRQRPAAVISAGFAGGLDPDLKVADLVADPSRSAAGFLRLAPGSVRCGTFLSVQTPLESVSAKAAAFAESAALAVDMETAAIAAACSEAAVPALFLRAISDAATDEIPLPFEASYDMARQRARPIGVCLALLRSPRQIPRFVHFLGDLKRARASLTRTIREVLAAGATSGWRSD